MPEMPLLIFRNHTSAAREIKKHGFGDQQCHFPNIARQRERLTSQFEAMEQLFIANDPTGLVPESVLVIETIGKIEDFQRAVRTIPGLEWLAEIDEEEIEPDRDFFNVCNIGKRLFSGNIKDINTQQSSQIWEGLKAHGFIDENGYIQDKNLNLFKQFIPIKLSKYTKEIIETVKDKIAETREEPISGRYFLSMSNKEAIDNLISFWNQWKTGLKKNPRGYGKWAEIFKYLKSIRPWGIQDRIRETGIIEYWNEELAIKRGTASKIRFEIEFWYRTESAKRSEIYLEIEQMISAEGGQILAQCLIDEIRFHAIKAELPSESIEKVIKLNYTKIFTSNHVMYFRPAGQCKVEAYSESEVGAGFESGSVSGEPIIAILDGAPYVSHRLLENRLILDDPDGFESEYQAKERLHGTAMASLICHGELNAGETPLLRPVYFRPIMKPDQLSRIELIPEEIFSEDLIERSVRRMFEGEGAESAIAPTVKVINLSIGDPSRMFFTQLSSWARLLDWLSEKYQVLFCVSAGNIKTDLDLGKTPAELNSLTGEEKSGITLRKIHEDIRNRRIIAPADSINALTIGALHSDQSVITKQGNRVDILGDPKLPSPCSAHGHGFRKSIKPEIYFPGGRQLFNYTDGQYSIADSGIAPGQYVATAPVSGGENMRCTYTRGTSNSAALASRAAAQIYEMLNSLRSDNGYAINEEMMAVLLKTLLVHGSSWKENCDTLKFCLINRSNSRDLRSIVARYIGYGVPKIERVLECAPHRATVIGYGKIGKNDKHEFELPLPPSLNGTNVIRRLTITLAWLSPVNSRSRKYRKASLSIEPPVESLRLKREDAHWQMVTNGTVQHEVLEGDEVISFREKETLKISVACREDAGSLDEEVNYGLAVTLEVGESVGLPIYEEIKERINVAVPIEERVS